MNDLDSKQNLPQDSELFALYSHAVADGINYVKARLAKNEYIGTYNHWPELSWAENGMPSFGEKLFDGPKDFKTAFSPRWDLIGVNSPDAHPAERESFRLVEKYIRSNELLARRSEPMLDVHVKLSIEYLIDRYLHIYGVNDDFAEDRFLSVYQPIEAALIDEKLYITILVPILFLAFDFESIQIAPAIFVERMSDELQLARAPDRQFVYGEHPLVQAGATHAICFQNYWIQNENWAAVGQIVARSHTYPLSEIDTFFAALKIITGQEGGYAQLLMKPVGWTLSYKANMPSIWGTVVRKYPSYFEDGRWREPVVKISFNEMKDVGNLFQELSNLMDNNQNPRMSLALARLNQSFLRDEEQDAILDLTIAMEALFSDSSEEMTHKLATRIAALYKLSKSSIQRDQVEVFEEVKYIYKFRSAIVHGDIKATEKRRVFKRMDNSVSTLELAKRHLRAAILILAKNPEYLDVKKIDNDLLLRAIPKTI